MGSMDSTASSLLETLTLYSSDPETITFQFSSYLRPFSNLNNKRKALRSSTTLRPLANKFLQFLSRSLELIPGLLRCQSPSLGSKRAAAILDAKRAAAILDVYRLVLDCMDSISPCLAGDSNFLLFERGGLVCFLELWGKYEEAKEEGVSVLKKLGIDVSSGVCGGLDDPEPEIVDLVWKVVCSLVRCLYKNKRQSKDGDEYEWVLGLVDLVGPKLRALDPKSMAKYHHKFVDSLYSCSLFLVAKYISFDSELVTRFCQMILSECLQSSMMDRFSSISCSICKSFDEEWERKPFLILDLLRVTLKNTLCGCKAGILKVVDEILEFVSYCAESFPADNIGICSHAVELLYEHDSDLVQVSPPVASIMFLYATGLYFKYNNFQAKHELEVLSLNKAPKKLQLLSYSVGVLIKYSTVSSYCRNEISLKHEVKGREIVDLESCCKQLHGNASLLSYFDAMFFLSEMLVEYVNMTWKCLTSQGKALCLSTNISEQIQDVMHQFCDFVLAAFRCQETSERAKQMLQERRTTLLQVAFSAFKLSLGTSSNHQKSLFLLNCVISSEWIKPQELEFLSAELGMVVVSLYNLGELKQASLALRLRCKTIWARVNLLYQLCSDESKGIRCGDKYDELRRTVPYAFEMCAWIIDYLHRLGAADSQEISFLEGNLYEIAVKSLVELYSADNMFPDSTASFVLVKQWVKMLCRDYKDANAVNNAPMLYSFLKPHCATWSNMM